MALRVKLKSTGQTGTLTNDKEFDPNIYELIGSSTTQPSAVSVPTTQSTDMLSPVSDAVGQPTTIPPPALDLGVKEETTQAEPSITLPNGVTVTRDMAFNAKLSDPQNSSLYDSIIEEIDRKTKLQLGVSEKAEEGEAGTRAVELLEKQYFGADGEQPLAFGKAGVGGRIGGVFKELERKVAPGQPGSPTERLNTYIRTLESVRPQLAKMAGDAGNIAFSEQLQAGKGLPQATDTPTEAIEMMQSAREKFGLEPSEELEQLKQELLSGEKIEGRVPEATPSLSGTLTRAGEGVGRFLFDETVDAVQDIVKSIGTGNKLKSIEKSRLEVDRLLKEGKTMEAEELIDAILAESIEMSEGFSKSVDESPWKRGAKIGLEIGTALEIPGATKAITKGGTALLRKAFTPKTLVKSLDDGLKVAKQGSALRDTAVDTAQKAGKKVNGTAIYEEFIDWTKHAKKAFPKSINEVDDLAKGLETTLKNKKMNPKDAQRIWDLTDSGFTQAGKTGTGLQKSFYREYRRLIRKHLSKVAPDFDKGTKMIKEGLDMEKLLKTIRIGEQKRVIKEGLKAPVPEAVKKYSGRVVGGAATALGLAGIAKLLGVRFSGGAESPM